MGPGRATGARYDGSAMRSVIATNAEGAKLTPQQLADAGVAPGEPAVIEIRPYDEAEWIAEGVGRVFSTEEFLEHLRRAPGPSDD